METKRERELAAFERLLDVMDTLREKCPWDHKQTLDSLRPQTIEETYELSDAIMKNDMPNICKELGDLLLHVVFYAKIGQEKEQFDIGDVCHKLCDKLIFRHPHVYGDAVAETAGDARVYAGISPSMVHYKDPEKVDIAIGKDACIYCDASVNVDWFSEKQPFGFKGLADLLEEIERGAL